MSIRGPKSVKLYRNGGLYAEMESVKATIDLLVLHDPKHRSLSTVRYMFKKARKNNSELFGFTFVEDPDWETSRAVIATDVETGEAFVKPSVSEMANVIFGPSKLYGALRVSEFCRNGETYRGLTFRYTNEDDCYKPGYCSAGGVINRKPIQQLDIDTGVVINEFMSIAKAAYYIWNMGISCAKCVRNIRVALSDCVNGAPKYNGRYLGYKWRFKPNSD